VLYVSLDAARGDCGMYEKMHSLKVACDAGSRIGRELCDKFNRTSNECGNILEGLG